MIGARIQCWSEKWKIQTPKVLVLASDLMHGYTVVSESASTVAIILVKSVLICLVDLVEKTIPGMSCLRLSRIGPCEFDSWKPSTYTIILPLRTNQFAW